MPVVEFNLVQHTTRAPFNKCYLCGTFDGPFIDTFVDQFGHGAVFLCTTKYNENGEEVKPGCIGQMARMSGFISSYEVSLMHDRIAELTTRVAELESLERQIVIGEGELEGYLSRIVPRLDEPQYTVEEG